MATSNSSDYFSSAKIIRLSQDHPIKPFDCDNCDLNGFLFDDAKVYLKYLVAVTYIWETSEKTIGYFSVANDLLRISVNSNRKFKAILRRKIKSDLLYKAFNWKDFPAVKVSRLAINKEDQCKGLGSKLLDAITYGFITNNKTGCMFIIVEALNNERAIKFYEKNDFVFMQDNDQYQESRMMYRCLINPALLSIT